MAHAVCRMAGEGMGPEIPGAARRVLETAAAASERRATASAFIRAAIGRL